MGFELITNFKAPYLVTNPTDFWRNWHISLSTWLRDYLYVPLGGNRCAAPRVYFNLMLTMLLGGLWHGAGAAYVLWGFFHGALLCVQRAWCNIFNSPRGVKTNLPAPNGFGSRLKNALLVILFFHVTCIGWVLFRAGSLPAKVSQVQMTMGYWRAMCHWPLAGGVSPLAQPVILLGGLALLFQWQHEKMDRFSTWQPRWQALAVTLALATITGLGVFKGTQFIYFQF
jgi:D-alanyl-lipoteichoic acid acyltransferase DltB (MBOAT superfamily)